MVTKIELQGPRPIIDRDDSYGIMGMVGPEGSGKTVLMSAFALRRHYQGIPILAFPGYKLLDFSGKQVTKPITTGDWINLPPEWRDVVICVDEIQNFFNSLKYSSTINMLWANILAARRHRNIEVLYTLQDWGLLDPRARGTTHYLAVCSDAYFSEWGRETGIGRGERIDWIMYDVKGFKTGRPWTPSRPCFLRAKKLWPCYDSYCDVDIWSGMSRVQIKRPTYTIDLTGGVTMPSGSGNPPGPNETPVGDQGAQDACLLDDLARGPMTPVKLRKLQKRLSSGK